MRASYIFRMGGSGGMNTELPNIKSVQDMPPKGGYPRVSLILIILFIHYNHSLSLSIDWLY